jgi:tRNA A-37 threonylcarbamoyl transferase component Bud32
VRLVPGEAFGRYRIEAEIGRGGQAVVYRATQVDLDRQVALKVFDDGYLQRSGAAERFRREAIAAGRLEHPRIVPVYDAGEIEGRAYISMRLVPGDTLAERVARTGPLPRDEALVVLSDIAEALDFAHANGTVHRDVKPANILLEPGGAWLSDFGLVRLDDMPGLTRRGDWLGTPEYVSPEQVEGDPATQGSDVYALAAVAFEALTGRPPFLRREPSAILLAHVRDERPRASDVRPGLPLELDAALARGLAVDPADRPASARELVQSVGEALDGAPEAPAVVPALVPMAVARTDAGADDDPWDAALARFADLEPARTATDSPTQALGVRGRRNPLLASRDLLTAAAVAGALLLIGVGVGGWLIGTSSADASGAEARGFQEGASQGKQSGFTDGRAQGRVEGRKAGKAEGLKQGRADGLKTGKAQGLAQGRTEGRAAGVTEGRSAALAGLSPGGWYILRVGSDDAGPVVSSPTSISTDASQCYTVSGGTVLSGPC